MRAFVALAWREWRRLRGTTLALVVLALLVLVVAMATALAKGSDARDVPSIVLFALIAPACGAVLGATTVAGDEALAFARARAAGGVRGAAARVLVRVAIGLAIVGGIAALIAGLGWTPWVDATGNLQMQGNAPVLLVFLVLGWLSAATVASSLARRPMSGLLAGCLLAACGTWLALRGFTAYDRFLGAGPAFLAIIAALGMAVALGLAAWRVRRHDVSVASGLLALGVATACVLVFGASVHAVTGMLAGRDERLAREAWTRVAPVEARGPDVTRPNEVARRLDAMVSPMRQQPGPHSDRRFDALWSLPPEWTADDREARRAASNEVVELILAWRPRIHEARDLLLSDQAPVWPPLEAKDVHGHLILGELLMAEARLAEAEGRAEDATSAVEASWRLRSALGFGSTLREELAVLRRLRQVPAHWSARLDAIDPVRSYLEGRRSQALSTMRRMRTLPFDGSFSWPPATEWEGALLRPWLRREIARKEHDMARLLLTDASRTSCATRLKPELGVSFEERSDRLAFQGRKGENRHVREAIGLAIEADLTRRALEVKGVRERTGTVPQSMGPWPVRGCSDLEWTWRLDPDGSGVLELSKAVEDPANTGLPWRPRHVEPATVPPLRAEARP